ncbi:uncharacterized protein LOC116532094 isoform X2 [Sapajus apella]|uniref:Uncharacterized protein LOC116532094 isoform X2 n=1 Tax=Sapajus apella TaxID=9515 RepID=A0A6J3FMU1_SAPAP|nr:uncharacterized protein LOC116532094 isoform X2 [Sapajus apella]
METEPRIAARGLHGGGAVSFPGACAKPASRRHFVSAAVAAAPSRFRFLARGKRSFHLVDSFFCGSHAPFPPGQHLVLDGGVSELSKVVLKKTEHLSGKYLKALLRVRLILWEN